MGPFPKAILIACLSIMRWLFFVAGGLMLLLIVVQQVRGDEGAAPLPLGIGAIIMLVLGFVSGKVSAFFEAES